MKKFDLNSSIRVHNKLLNMWFVVSKGCVYDEITGIKMRKDSAIAISAKKFVEKILSESLEDLADYGAYASSTTAKKAQKTYNRCIKALNI